MDKSLEKLSLAEVMTTMKGDNLKLKEIIRSGIWKGEMGNKILKFYIHALAKQNTFICLSLDGSGEMLVPDGFELNKDSISFPLEIFAEVAGGLVAEYLIPDYELSSDYELANDLKEVSSEKGLFKKEMIKNNLEDIRYLLNVEELRNIQGKYEEKFPKFIEEIKDNINNIKNIDPDFGGVIV